MKKILLSILILVLIVLGILLYVKNTNKTDTSNVQETSRQTSFDAKNSSFTVENAPVTLVNGLSEIHPASIPTATITTRYFGNEAKGDLDNDGREDIAFLITQDGGGSGLFYYVVVALNTVQGYKTTNAFLIGDRIAPQSTEIHSDSGELHVNFAQRRKAEPMTAQPSEGAVLLLKVTPAGVLEGLMK